MFSTIIAKLKEILKKMIGNRTIEQELHIAPAVSSKMENAILLWDSMYKNEAPWLHEPDFNNPVRIVSLGLPSMIASEKARMTLLELESEITTPTKEIEKPNPNYVAPGTKLFSPGDSTGETEGYTSPLNPLAFQPETITETEPVGAPERANFLNEQYKVLKEQHLRKQLEYGIAKGGFVIKPYPVEVSQQQMLGESSVDENGQPIKKQAYKFMFDFIQADAFYPISFDASGNATEAAFIQTRVEQNIIYRRLEYHKWENDTVRIINKAYKSTQNMDSSINNTDLGQEINLSEVPEWKDLASDTTIANVSRPLFAYFKMPEANTVDTKSPLGVSGYSRAVSLIKDADMQYSRLLWEYEAGEMAINIDRNAFNFMSDPKREDHKTILGSMQNRLYRKVDIDENELFEPYAPSLRDAQYIQGLNAILMRIEDATGLSRGTLSDVAAEARTATELKILKQRSYAVNAEIQRALETTLRDVIYIMNVYCDLYNITPDGDYDVSFEWDDSILVDVERELNKRLTLYQNGLESKLEIRKWYFGETERQAREALAKITEEQLTSIDTPEMMTVGQYNPKMNTGEKR